MKDVAQYRRWCQRQLERLDDIYGYLDEEPTLVEEHLVWTAEVVKKAADRAARLGFADLVDRSGALLGMAETIEAKAFLAACIDQCRKSSTGDAAGGGLLSIAQAAKRLNMSERSLRRLVDRSRRRMEGQRLRGPTIKFYQAHRNAPIQFEPAWIDEYLSGHMHDPTRQRAPHSAPKKPKSTEKVVLDGNRRAWADVDVPGFD